MVPLQVHVPMDPSISRPAALWHHGHRVKTELLTLKPGCGEFGIPVQRLKEEEKTAEFREVNQQRNAQRAQSATSVGQSHHTDRNS